MLRNWCSFLGEDWQPEFEFSDDAPAKENKGSGDSPFDVSACYTEEDGERTTTHVEIRKTCMVYDGDPQDGGSKLIGASDTAQFAVRISNRGATGTTGGEVKTVVGADES